VFWEKAGSKAVRIVTSVLLDLSVSDSDAG
jgi:hypothetical protein